MLLEIKNLSVSINNKAILKDISMQFEKGKINAIIGPNGCGKSTLIKAISSDISYEGNINFNDVNQKKIPNREKAHCRFVLSQENFFSFPFSVYEILDLGNIPHRDTLSLTKQKENILYYLESFNLTSYQEKDYQILSGGQRKITQFARVMVQFRGSPKKNNEKIILLDEPVNHLDLKYIYTIIQTLKDLSQKGVTIVVILHDIQLASQIADKIFIINKGVLFKEGDKSIINKKNIKEVYEIDYPLVF